METANAFHRDDLSPTYRRHRARQRRFMRHGWSVGRINRPPFETRPAPRTRIRLRVITAALGIVVFRLTLRAEMKCAHRSIGAIVRQRGDDAEPRSAVRAIDERIAIPAVGKIEQFRAAIRARRKVGQHQCGFVTAGFAVANLESDFAAPNIEPRCLAVFNATARWPLTFQLPLKILQRRRATLGFDQHALRRVFHPPSQFQFPRQPAHEGTKANALHRAGDNKPDAGNFANGFGFQRGHDQRHHPPIVEFALNSACQSSRRNCQSKWGRNRRAAGEFPVMHEVSLLTEALRLALQAAENAPARRIVSVQLRVGALSGVVPDAMQFAWDIVRRDTIAANASLSIESVPVTYWCGECGAEFVTENFSNECPRCRELSGDLRRGRELELARVELE